MRAATLTVGLVLAVGAPLWWFSHDGPTPVVAVNPGALHRLADPLRPADSPLGVREGVTREGRLPVIPVSPVGGDLLPVRTVAQPVEVTIPSLSVLAQVRSVGVAEDGQVAIPRSIHEVGWFRWGSSPSDRSGSVVLVGHLDSATQPGFGALAYLRNVEAGALIRVVTSDGRIWSYRVVARQEIAKTRLPLGEIFARTGRPRLILMTCGGSFDRASRSYDDTIVVTATPVDNGRPPSALRPLRP